MVRSFVNRDSPRSRIGQVRDKIGFAIWRLATHIGSAGGSASRFPAHAVCCHSPQELTCTPMRHIDIHPDRVRIVGGNWDLTTATLESTRTFRGLQERFVLGRGWEDTTWYHRWSESVEREPTCGIDRWLVSIGRDDLRRKCFEVEQFFREARERWAHADLSYRHRIMLGVGRHGDIFVLDGAPWLICLQLAGVDRFPMRIAVRHPDWQTLRSEIQQYVDDFCSGRGGTYQPLVHPDLGDFHSARSDKRLQMIQATLPVPRGRLLDIGANWGYFCIKLERLGFDCHAVESKVAAQYFLKRLRRASGCHFRVYEASVFDCHVVSAMKFDVVLALNVFHHFIKDSLQHRKLVDLLSHLRMDAMYFQAHVPTEGQMVNAYRNYEPDEFVRFILANSCLSKACVLGEDVGSEGVSRPVFLLTRE